MKCGAPYKKQYLNEKYRRNPFIVKKIGFLTPKKIRIYLHYFKSIENILTTFASDIYFIYYVTKSLYVRKFVTVSIQTQVKKTRHTLECSHTTLGDPDRMNVIFQHFSQFDLISYKARYVS